MGPMPSTCFYGGSECISLRPLGWTTPAGQKGPEEVPSMRRMRLVLVDTSCTLSKLPCTSLHQEPGRGNQYKDFPGFNMP